MCSFGASPRWDSEGAKAAQECCGDDEVSHSCAPAYVSAHKLTNVDAADAFVGPERAVSARRRWLRHAASERRGGAVELQHAGARLQNLLFCSCFVVRAALDRRPPPSVIFPYPLYLTFQPFVVSYPHRSRWFLCFLLPQDVSA